MSTAVFNLSQTLNNSFGHTLSAQLASNSSTQSSSFRPPSSPPQPIPNTYRNPNEYFETPDERATQSSCPTSSPLGTSYDVYHDCSVYLDCAEVSSVASSLEVDLCTNSSKATSVKHSCETTAATSHWEQQCAEERRLRQGAQAAASSLQSQLSSIRRIVLEKYLAEQAVQSSSSQLDAFSEGEGGDGEVPAAVAAMVRQSQGLQRALTQLHAEKEGQLEAARLASAACARASATADLHRQWTEEKAVLERRLEQSARLVEAMLKHSKQSERRPEPWQQQVLSGVLSLGGLALGAAAAALIITRWNASGGAGGSRAAL